MAILKMRDADGKIKSIAIMKGDKGDGVPDGGSAGQIFKKTADGTEWADFASTPAVVMSNPDTTDTTVTSVAITQRGLYEVEVARYGNGAYDERNIHLVSIDDLSKARKWEYIWYIYHMNYATNERVAENILTLAYENGELSSQIVQRTMYDTATSGFHTSYMVLDNSHRIVEVKLLIPYA